MYTAHTNVKESRPTAKIVAWFFAMAVILAFGVPQVPAAAQEEIVIAVWTGPEADNLKRIADIYHQETGVRIRVDEVARDAFRTKASTVLLSGSPAWDLVWLVGDWLPEMAKANAIVPLDNVMSDQEIAPLTGLYGTTFEGKLYGIPTEYHALYLFYRKDLLKEAGLSVPRTWDEFLDAARALTVDSNNDGRPEQYGTVIRGGGGSGNTSIHYEFGTFFLGFGGRWLDDQMNPAVNSPEAVESLTYFTDLLNEYHVVPPDASAVGYLEKNQYFQSGRVAMMIQWSAAYEPMFNCETSPDVCEKTAITVVPGRMVNDEIERGVLASLEAWVVPTASEKKDLAYDFLHWIASYEGAKEWALGGGDPSNGDVYTDPEVLEARPDFEILGESLKFAQIPPRLPESAQLLQVWARELALALQERQTPQQALENVDEEWTEILN